MENWNKPSLASISSAGRTVPDYVLAWFILTGIRHTFWYRKNKRLLNINAVVLIISIIVSYYPNNLLHRHSIRH